MTKPIDEIAREMRGAAENPDCGYVEYDARDVGVVIIEASSLRALLDDREAKAREHDALAALLNDAAAALRPFATSATHSVNQMRRALSVLTDIEAATKKVTPHT